MIIIIKPSTHILPRVHRVNLSAELKAETYLDLLLMYRT